jgi:hypothetical protein
MDHSKLFYVLNGLVNGERGCPAFKAGGGGPDDEKLRDGHYYVLGDDVDGRGPFPNIESCWDACDQAMRTQVWALPLDFNDDNKPYHIKDDDYGAMSDCNIVTIVLEDAQGQRLFTATVEGSYETLTLTMSAPSYEAVADVMHHTVQAAGKYL